MITISIDTDSRGTDRAQCWVDSRFFAAQSRSGAIHALCRVLHGAGIRTRRWKAPAFPARKAQKGGAEPQVAIRAGGELQDAPARHHAPA